MDKDYHAKQNLPQERDLLESFDIERFWYVLKQSKFWILGIILFLTLTAYLYVRYTKNTYKSESVVKLDFQSEANVLGITDVINTQERNEISGEIELIKSKLFLSRVVDAADLHVSYHVYGRYLTDERYLNSPFVISYKVLNEWVYNNPIDVEIVDDTQFVLSYNYYGREIKSAFKFGDEITTEVFNLAIDKTVSFDESVIGSRFYFTINSKAYLLNYVQRGLEVVPENFNAKTIRIAFSDFKARKARDLVSIIDSLYLNYTKEVKNQAIEQKIQFLNNQINETEQKLSEFEEYFEQFTIQNRTTDLGQDLNRTITQLFKVDSQRFTLRNRIADLKSIQEKVRVDGVAIVDPILAGYLPEPLSTSLKEYGELQQERELKLASYNETSYLIKQLNLQLDKSKSNLGKLIQSYEQILNDQLSNVDEQRSYYESSLYQLPSMGTEYSKKRRVYNLQEELLLSLQTSRMELGITRAGTVTNNIILSPATLPTHPIKPQKLLIIIAGFVVGLVLSVIFLLVKYIVHNKIAGLRELERMIQTPVLGGVPDFSKKLEVTSMVVDIEETSAVSEALRTIRTNMDFLGNGKPTKIISVTSTVSGEGKTFVATNLGAIMAMTGKRVVVVDFDMRKPKIHIAFGKENKAEGVSTVLAGQSNLKNAIEESRIKNLYFIPSGPTPPNPSELLLQKEFSDLMEHLEQEFDIIILDTPPVGLVTDGRIIMKSSDIQLYVVRADFSKRSYVKVVNDLHSSGQFKGMATILNSIDNTPVYGYGYGYGYGYYDEGKSKLKKASSMT